MDFRRSLLKAHMIIKSNLHLIGISLLLGACGNFISSTKSHKKLKSPNFILILADDQGWNGTSVQMMRDEPLSKSDYF